MLLILTPGYSWAEERITTFQSDIKVFANGSIEVLETIDVVAEGHRIQRGIYRDFPTDYSDSEGGHHRVSFTVLDVQKDGEVSPWFSKKRSNGVRIYIGEKNTRVAKGPIRYQLRYRSDRQLGFFEDNDELYWNVTGNGWLFTIEKATARVILPEGIPTTEIKLDGYTGPDGARDKNVSIDFDLENTYRWQTTQPLQKNEGLTLVLGWPKGYVEPPDARQRFLWWLRDHSEFGAGLLSLLPALGLFYLLWRKVGRDPRKGVIIAQYQAPAALSPAALSPAAIYYIYTMRWSATGLSAAIIDLAARGYQNISELGVRHYKLTKNADADIPPGSDQQTLFDALYRNNDSVDIKRGHHRAISRATKALKRKLKEHYYGLYFSRNAAYLVPGLITSYFALLYTGFKYATDVPGFIGLYHPAIVLMSLAIYLIQAKQGTAQSKLVLFILGVFMLACGAGLVEVVGFWYVILLVLAGLMAATFSHLMQVYTPAGRKLMDEIEGFKLYLSTAEQARLNLLNPPERTPELFEQLLPYALVLKVENEWAEQFGEILKSASDSEGQPYRPGWYSGSNWQHSRPAVFAGALGVGLVSTISAASVAPGSSSGSSSSSFSGGGGGGGGW